MYAVAAFVAGLVAATAPAGAPVAQRAASHQQRPLVQRLSLQQLAGRRIVSLAATAKHFPGLGVRVTEPEHRSRAGDDSVVAVRAPSR
jgi:hypothetical protein